MQINRLFEIVYLLLGQTNHKKIRARELAERFEVSERTIYRDIDALSEAGIPVYTQKGRDGGIALLDGFVLDRSVLSEAERKSILFSLRSLQVTRLPEVDEALSKLGALFSSANDDWIAIDFSPWGCDPNAQDRLNVIKAAILKSRTLEFDYVSAENVRTKRCVQPIRLLFKAHTWYLLAWDEIREDLRTFRLSRLHGVHMSDRLFDRRIPLEAERLQNHDNEECWNDGTVTILLKLHFREAAFVRLCDDFNEHLIQNNGDNTYTVIVSMPKNEWMFGYLLSFGESLEVLSPACVREELGRRLKEMLKFYC